MVFLRYFLKLLWGSVYSGPSFSFLHLSDNSENLRENWYLLDFLLSVFAGEANCSSRSRVSDTASLLTGLSSPLWCVFFPTVYFFLLNRVESCQMYT